MAARLGAAALAGAGAVELLGLALRAVLGGVHPSLLDGVLGGAGVVGAALLAVNRVTDRSAGAVDNAAGGITAVAPGDAPPPHVPGGVILPDAAEDGPLGAPAPVRGRAHLLPD